MPPPAADLSVFTRCALIVVAGGSGTRFGGPKQFAPLGGKPLLAHSLLAFETLPFAQRIVVLPQQHLDSPDWAAVTACLKKPVQAVAGGAQRADSVRNGLLAAPSAHFVAVHDGARPFPPVEATVDCLLRLKADATLSGVIVAAPVTDTLKQVLPDGAIHKTIDRTRVARAQTPQVCRRNVLLEALEQTASQSPTDEAQALELLGHKTAVVLSRAPNLKITEIEDLCAAEAMLAARSS